MDTTLNIDISSSVDFPEGNKEGRLCSVHGSIHTCVARQGITQLVLLVDPEGGLPESDQFISKQISFFPIFPIGCWDEFQAIIKPCDAGPATETV